MSLRGLVWFCLLGLALPARADERLAQGDTGLTLAIFGAFIGLTLLITWWASRRVSTTNEFYAAGRGLTGAQNGWAIAGEYLTAVSFLGVTGLVALYGYDGLTYLVGFLAAYVVVLLVVAEPCRNIGRYTLGDILAFRNEAKATRSAAALTTLTVSIIYLTAQMVGGGLLIKALIGIDYGISIVAVGLLMLVYVVFGGMLATTWVQIVKAMLLVAAAFVLVILVWLPYGFSLPALLDALVQDAKVQARVAELLGPAAAQLSGEALGQRFLEPGLFFEQPLDRFSLGLALVLGTAGMPHILMRFITVPDAQAARQSVVWAMAIIGVFYLLTLLLGLGAALQVGPEAITALDRGGNLAAPLLAQHLGGGAGSLWGNVLLAFVAAVAFATIVAVVAGLVLASASALAHDVYVSVLRNDHASSLEQINAARIAALLVGGLAIAIGMLAEGQNVAHLVGMAFAVAASSNLPALLLTLYWKRCNTAGILLGMGLGGVSAIVLMLISPNMTYPQQEVAAARALLDSGPAQAAQAEKARAGWRCELFSVCAAAEPARPALPAQAPAAERLARLEAEPATPAQAAAVARLRADIAAAEATLVRHGGRQTSWVGLEEPLFRLKNPGILSIPLGFLGVLLGSLLFRDPRAEEMWDELNVRQHTGLHAAHH